MLSAFKWSGSKRFQVKDIMEHMPDNIENFYEAFVGSGIVTLSLLKEYSNKLSKNCNIYCSDINSDIITLWNIVKNNPDELYKKYEAYWQEYNSKINEDDETCRLHRKKVYYDIRQKYNETKDAYMFFFLMRTAINGLIRFNNNTGNFNSPCAYINSGMHPNKIKEIITDVNSLLIKYNVQFYNKSYNEVLNEAPENSVIYLDPPYYESFGMYYGKFDFREFNENISKYANKHRKVIISFDEKPVDEIDFSLYNKYKIYNGKSGFKKLHKEDSKVFESLYVSKNE